MAEQEEKNIQEEIKIQILLADQVVISAQEAESWKRDCLNLAQHATQLFELLRSTAEITSAAHSLYLRPLRPIITTVSINLRQALSLVQNCRHNRILHFIFSITTTTSSEFHNVASHLESSISDVKWLIAIFSFDGTANLYLPSIANKNPILSCVWSNIAKLQMGQPGDRIDGANNLAFFAGDDRWRKIIVEEGGIARLLNLLKEHSRDARVAALTALYNLATDQDSVRLMAIEHAVPIIAQILGDFSIDFQDLAVNLVSRMGEMDIDVQEEFGKKTVTRTIMTLLPTKVCSSSSNFDYDKRVIISCVNALSKLSKGSLKNTRIISEPESLLCLAKLIEKEKGEQSLHWLAKLNEKEKGELRTNCLNTLMALTEVAESNTELRQTAFKLKSHSMNALLDELLTILDKEKDPQLLIPTIKSLGSLARTFTAKDTRVINLLVNQLGHSNADVSTEAIVALAKFVCPENFNRVENSNSIIKFQGVPLLMILLKNNDISQVSGLVLLCYLALYGGNGSVLVQARALNVLESRVEFAVSHNPELRELFEQAIHQLTLYQAGA